MQRKTLPLFLRVQRIIKSSPGITKAPFEPTKVTHRSSRSQKVMCRIADAFLFCPRSLGHSNCVRALVALTTKEFLSCSNDCTIKRWTLDSSQCIQTFQGHTSFVYSISMISPDLFVSVSEDRSARVWSIDTDESVQTIRLPSPTLWSVCSLTNGDVAIACRFASSECIEQWLTESILVMAASAYSRKRNHAWQR